MLINSPFYHSVSNMEVSQKTSLIISHLKDGLHFTFKCADDPFVIYNEFRENNQPLWQQEVLEVFISAGNEISSSYIEFQINPNNAIFLAEINNPCLKGKNNTLKFIDPSLHSINSTANINLDNNQWSGEFTLPFTLIGGDHYNYRMNIFRIIAEHKPTSSNWKNSVETSTYACWKPTSGLSKPSFHQPASFASIQF